MRVRNKGLLREAFFFRGWPTLMGAVTAWANGGQIGQVTFTQAIHREKKLLIAIRRLSVIVLASLIAACASAPQEPVQLNASSSLASGTRVGVILVDVPKPDTSFPGAGCLLCYAAASAGNSSLTKQVKTWGTEDLVALRADATKALKAKGVNAVAVDESVDLSKLPKGPGGVNKPAYDFGALGKKYAFDKALVIQLQSVGVSRAYSAYVPTDVPRSEVQGMVYLVDLTSQAYEWYQVLKASRPAAGNWDEPPSFPGITNAYFQAIEDTRDAVLKPISAH